MRVKIIASHPAPGQDEVQLLIGEVYEVVNLPIIKRGRVAGEVSVRSKNCGGVIVLNPDEFHVTRAKTTRDNKY